jgi:hypothetical protein
MTSQIVARQSPTTHPSTFLLIAFPTTFMCGAVWYAAMLLGHHYSQARLERFPLLAAPPRGRASLRLGMWVQAGMPLIATYPLCIALLALTAPDSVQLKTAQPHDVYSIVAITIVATVAQFALIWWLVGRFWSVDTRIDWPRVEVECRDREMWRATPWRSVGRIDRFEISGCNERDIAPVVHESSGVVDWLFAVTAEEYVPIASSDSNYWPYFRHERLKELEQLLNQRLSASRPDASQTSAGDVANQEPKRKSG